MIKNSPFYRSEENNQKTACKIDIFMSISKKVVSIKLHAKEGIAILSSFYPAGKNLSPPWLFLALCPVVMVLQPEDQQCSPCFFRNKAHIRLKQTFGLPETEPLFR